MSNYKFKPKYKNEEKVDFSIGYGEWNLYIDEEYIISYGAEALSEDLFDANSEELKWIVEEMIALIQNDIKETTKEELKKTMFFKLKEYYLD